MRKAKGVQANLHFSTSIFFFRGINKEFFHYSEKNVLIRLKTLFGVYPKKYRPAEKLYSGWAAIFSIKD